MEAKDTQAKASNAADKVARVGKVDKVNKVDSVSKVLKVSNDNHAQHPKYGWEVKKLGEVCEFSQGIQVPIEEQYNQCKEGMIRFLRIIDFTQEGEIPRYIQNVGERYILHDNETAIVRYGTPGFVCYGKYGIIANNLFKILPKKDIFNTPFLRYWLKSNAFQGVIRGRKYGVALQAIKFSTISHIPIPIPPMEEQERIVAELDCLSGVIEKKRQQLKEYDVLAQSIFYDMFGDPISNEKGWEVIPLKKASLLKAGKAIKANELLENLSEGLFPCFGGNGIRGYINKKSHSGNFPIIGRQGALCGNVVFAQGEFYATEHAVVCNNIIDSINPLWFYFALKHNNLNRFAQGVAQPGISVNIINEMPLILPPLSLQQEFAEKVEAIEKQKELVKQSIAEAETLFNARMEYYFGDT